MSIAEKFVSMEYGPAPEDSKEASAWLDRHDRRFGLFIHGAWQSPAAGEYFDTLDPSNGEKLAAVAQGGVADIDAAVRAARAASAAVASPRVRMRGHGIFMLSHGWCKNIRDCSRFSKPWTTGSLFARAATSISHWSHGISTIMPAGRNCSIRSSPATNLAE